MIAQHLNMTDTRVTFGYVFTALLAVLTTWVLHEFAHWVSSESLGYDTIMTLNATSPVKGQSVSEWHRFLISASGPLITVFQAIIVFIFLQKTWSKHLYLFLFIAFYMRSLAGIMNIISPNDEGRISEYLGIGLYTIPFLVSAFLFYLVYLTSKRYRLDRKFQLATIFATLIFTSALILIDQFMGVRIL